MTYSINTIKYTARKVVDINGTIFKVRKLTTDEQFTLAELDEQVKVGKSAKELKTLVTKELDIFFGTFDNVELAKEILKDIEPKDIAGLYQDIMENAKNESAEEA